jgi:hypothetical protein
MMDVHRVIHMPGSFWNNVLAVVFCSAFFSPVWQLRAQRPVLESLQDGPASEALHGVVPMMPAISAARAHSECIQLPAPPPDDRLLGPHGGSLISSRCEVIAYQAPEGARSGEWIAARYRWKSIFTASDSTRGAAARDTATEEEVVLFQTAGGTNVRPVWHARFDTGEYAIWRSITPEITRTRQGTMLLSAMYCVNGTGGCSQEFLQRHLDGHWFEIKQAWLDQLPPGFKGRIRHGVRIEPATLTGEAGFYGDQDPNCCPSQVLKVNLALRGDSLLLIGQKVVAAP